MDGDDDFKRLIYNYWKTGRFASKLDLIALMYNNILGRTKEQYVELVEDVLTNIDKYDKMYKQTKIEQFFIELLELLDKYHVSIHVDCTEEDEKDMRIFFESADGTFCQDYDDSIDPEAANGFEECVEEGEKPRTYSFPAVKYFKEQGIEVK